MATQESALHRTRDGRVFRARQRNTTEDYHHQRRGQNLARAVAGDGNGANWPQEVRQLREACFDRGRSSRSAPVTASHWSYWLAFCKGWDIRPDSFGDLSGAFSVHDAVLRELDTLAAFAIYIVFFPRTSRHLKKTNSVDYALGVISSVRSHYATRSGRAPGKSQVAGADYCFKRIVSGLRKMAAHTKVRKVPLLQHHLQALRRQLDLQESQRDRVFWTLWLTQWQGVLRSADLIKPRSESNTALEPGKETHRGRLAVDSVTLNGERFKRFTLNLKPTKTDQAGEEGFEKTFLIDRSPDSLSAGLALYNMLRSDPDIGELPSNPLFRDPRTGKEVTIEDSCARLRECLVSSGLESLNATPHCLRIDGATAFANSESGGDLVAGFMGLWVSDAKYDYFHALQPRLERASLSIGREGGQALAGRPGPVSSYAGRRA